VFFWHTFVPIDGARGSGTKTQIRPCSLTFVK
jgi:hypothetical protein